MICSLHLAFHYFAFLQALFLAKETVIKDGAYNKKVEIKKVFRGGGPFLL